jgi:hypothetical protein
MQLDKVMSHYQQSMPNYFEIVDLTRQHPLDVDDDVVDVSDGNHHQTMKTLQYDHYESSANSFY